MSRFWWSGNCLLRKGSDERVGSEMFIVPLLVLLAVSFTVLVVLLRWVMTRHMTSTTTYLQGLSQDYLRKQEELKKRSEDAERYYQEQLANAQQEIQQLKSQGLKEAEVARQQLIDQAHQEADRLVQQAIQARDTVQHDSAKTLEAKAVQRACELVQRVLPQLLSDALHGQWLEELIQNGLLPLERLQTREDIQEAQVVSAVALTPAQRKRLAERLEKTLGHAVTIHESVDAKIVAGLVITAGHLVLDGSFATKLREAARHVQG